MVRRALNGNGALKKSLAGGERGYGIGNAMWTRGQSWGFWCDGRAKKQNKEEEREQQRGEMRSKAAECLTNPPFQVVVVHDCCLESQFSVICSLLLRTIAAAANGNDGGFQGGEARLLSCGLVCTIRRYLQLTWINN